MNILIPDSWLREYLDTKATPEEIKKYLSLCGPSVERINTTNGEVVYDIEVTSNRPDSMSVSGIAREASAILPRFGIKARFKNDPYNIKGKSLRQRRIGLWPKNSKVKSNKSKRVKIITDPVLNPRWTSVIIDHVKVGPSPKWLKEKLELSGIRSLNNVIDVTNYLMRSFGQPAHAFDFAEIKPDKSGMPFMKLRLSKKGESITTLDGKIHKLQGEDIVIEDGSGRLIDLCGIMGAQNSSIKPDTKTILLFMQTYDPVRIRRTMMTLSHRSEAGSLFEKGLDSELVMPTVLKGIELIEELTGGKTAGEIYDNYPKPYKPYAVSVKKNKINAYLGTELQNKDIYKILNSLNLKGHSGNQSVDWLIESRSKKNSKLDPIVPALQGLQDDRLIVTVPSFRQDIKIGEDIIEEIARIYGYHNLKIKLPDSEPPVVIPDPKLTWEEEVKIRLRDWGFTEIYSYSMVSSSILDIFQIDKTKVYKITNPLSDDWEYLRPHLFLSMVNCIKENLHIRSNFKLFELSHDYVYRENDLPLEKPALVVVWTGNKFLEAKGIAQALFKLFGIDYEEQITSPGLKLLDIYTNIKIFFGNYGSVGLIKPEILTKLGINQEITRLYLDFGLLVQNAKPQKKYRAIPKFSPIIEDLSFDLVPGTFVGNVIIAIKSISTLIRDVRLFNQYENTSTIRIEFLDFDKQLTSIDVRPVREEIIKSVEEKFNARLKS